MGCEDWGKLRMRPGGFVRYLRSVLVVVVVVFWIKESLLVFVFVVRLCMYQNTATASYTGYYGRIY